MSLPQRTTRHFQTTATMIAATLILSALVLVTSWDDSETQNHE